MPDYETMYHMLFNEITNTIEKLKAVQQKCEELFIDSEKDSDDVINEK